MFTVEDCDMPIDVAQKLIKGRKRVNKTDVQIWASKVFSKTATDSPDDDTFEADMFDTDEIREIADYLIAFCNARERSCG